MQLHAPLVALFDGKGQRVVSGIASCFARKRFAPYLDVGRINKVSAHACLEDDRIDVDCLQLVEDVGQLLFLLGNVGLTLDLCGRPVESSEGSEPYGTP